jgi:hypothetical protein
MRALWVGLKSTVRCAIGRADQAPISAIDAWQLALAWLAAAPWWVLCYPSLMWP